MTGALDCGRGKMMSLGVEFYNLWHRPNLWWHL